MNETDYEIVDLGIHHPDSFQGFGVSFTRFEHCVYGIGYTAQEAYDDALDQLCDRDGISPDDLPKQCPFGGAVTTDPDDTGMNDYANQAYYHVGIRYGLQGRNR